MFIIHCDNAVIAITIPICVRIVKILSNNTFCGPIILSITRPTSIGTYNVEATVTAAIIIEIARYSQYLLILFKTFINVLFWEALFLISALLLIGCLLFVKLRIIYFLIYFT